METMNQRPKSPWKSSAVPDERIGEFNPSRFIFARKRKGFSQIELAEKLAITNRAVVAYETGEYCCVLHETRIVQILACSSTIKHASIFP
jgi:ribosome-binding protein aMBF1 (putative translation factor)